MIKYEHPYIDDQGIEHTDKLKIYSDQGLQLEQVETGRKYDSVVDLHPSKYTYKESDTPVNC